MDWPPAAALAILLALVPTPVRPFNLDVERYTTFRGDPDSYFGFSVALHKDLGESWVLVGAPKAQTQQYKVTRGGAVYGCSIEDGQCSQKIFDESGHNFGSSGDEWIQMDDKNDQWFGASLYSSRDDGPVVACAPRYIYTPKIYGGSKRKEPVGTCFLARNQFRNVSEYAPCRNSMFGFNRQGSCQAGLGVAISRDGERLFIGAVGSWYWQGELYSLNDHAIFPFVPLEKTFENERGRLVSQSTHSRPDFLSTTPDPVSKDNTYMGYSLTVGDFGGSVPGHEDVAVGRPRSGDLNGEVLILTWNLTSLQNITGEQLGSYFGYSLATNDVNGDGMDDLIVGAPFYSHLQNNADSYETGRVYIFYQGNGVNMFSHVSVKDGKKSKGRFGLSLTTLGDINKDGFGDFAVGAPYDGPEERGAVYLFHGGAEGVRETHSQVIYAEDVVGSPSTFGFSISGGRDLDKNHYPDLVVGAYESNTAVFLRARPVVNVNASINFLSEGKQIALEERNCTLPDSTRVPCIQLKSCLKYYGEGVGGRLDFQIQYVLDIKKQKSQRLFFMSGGKNVLNKSKRLNKEEEYCEDMLVYLKPNVRDKLTSLDAEINYSLIESSSTSRRELRPILDLNKELSRKDSLSIRKNCGKDNICIPDLRLIAQPNVKRYLLGSGQRFNLSILIENEGEDAFESSFETTIPPGMNYVKIERIDEREKEIPVQCSPPTFNNNYTLHCDIGNPLPGDKLVEFKVVLQPFHQDGMKPRYEFQMRVNSTNPENSLTVSDNYQHITVPIWVETDLILEGSSHPPDVHYNISLYSKTDNFTHENEIGPQVIHVYGIRNKGPSDIEEAEAYFLWPSYTLAGDHLLYLLEQPEISGNIRCEHVEEINVEHLILDRKRKSFLDYHGERGEQGGLTSSRTSESSGSESSSQTSTVEHESSGSSSSSSHSSGSTLITEEKRINEESLKKKKYEEEIKETRGSYERHGEKIGSSFKEIHYSSNGGRIESDSHSKTVNSNDKGEASKTVIGTDRNFEQNNKERHSSGSSVIGSFGSGSAGRGGGHVHYEEKEETSKTTWKSGGLPHTVTSTKWKTVDDGVEKSGGSSRTHSGTTINLANLGLSSEGNRRYTIVGSGGGRVYSEERHYEKNSTWNSREGVQIQRGSSGSSSVGGQGTFGTAVSDYGIRGKKVDSSTDIHHRGTIHDGNFSHREYDTGIRHSSNSDRESSHSHHSQLHGSQSFETQEDKFSQRGNERTSQNVNSDRGRSGYSDDKQHKSTGIVGSDHTSIAGVSNVDSYNYERTGSTNSHNQHTGESRTNARGQGSAHRGTTYDDRRTYSESGGRRNEGRHRIHWSSEHSSGSGIQTDSTVNNQEGGIVEENKRTIGSQGFGQDGSFHGGRTYAEQHSHQWNTTWNSAEGGKPKTTEVRKWSVNEDGTFRNGSYRDSYEGAAKLDEDFNKHLLVSSDKGGFYVEPNLVRTGKTGTIYSEEKETTYNTTWNSASGGLPITRQQTNWKVNKDGVVTSGSKSDTFEGTPPILHQSEHNVRGTTLAGSRRQELDFENRHGERRQDSAMSTFSHQEVRNREGEISGSSNVHRQGTAEAESHFHTVHSTGGGTIENKRYEESAGSHGSDYEKNVRSHQSGTISVGDLLGGSQSSSGLATSFNHFGEIAKGPKNGVAKTYTLDLGINSESNADFSGSRHRGHSESHSSSLGESEIKEKHYSLSNPSSSDRNEESHGFSYRNRDRLEGIGGAMHSTWSHGSTLHSSADGDNPQHGGAYGVRKVSETTSHRHISDDSNRGKFQFYPRYRRQVEEEDLEKSLSCGPTDCITIKCTLGPLKKDEKALVAFRSRVWIPTIRKLSTNVEIGLSSLVVARVTRLPHIGTPDVVTKHSYEIHSQIPPPDSPVKPDIIPLWIVVLSACAGAIILMLLVYLLYKCNFFKRNRPSSAPEKQPLNRNGYHHGDEAL